MRTVFACHGATSAGAERTLVSLARAAADRGDEVTFVVPRDGPVVALVEAEVPTAEVVRCPTQWWMGIDHTGIMGLLRLVQGLLHVVGWVALLRRVRPDRVVVGASVAPAPLAAARLLRVPVATILGESIRTNPTLRSVLPKTLIVRCLHRWSDVTLGVSQFAAAQYGGTDLVEAPDVVVPESTTRPHALPRPQRPGQLLSRVVMLGTLSTEKGQLDAVRAIGLLPARCSSVRLDLFGDAGPDDLLELDRLVGALGLRGRVQRHREQRQPARDPACRRRQPRLLAQRGLRPGHRRVDPGRYTRRGIRDGRYRGDPVPGRRHPRRPDASRHGRGPRHAGERPGPASRAFVGRRRTGVMTGQASVTRRPPSSAWTGSSDSEHHDQQQPGRHLDPYARMGST